MTGLCAIRYHPSSCKLQKTGLNFLLSAQGSSAVSLCRAELAPGHPVLHRPSTGDCVTGAGNSSAGFLPGLARDVRKMRAMKMLRGLEHL